MKHVFSRIATFFLLMSVVLSGAPVAAQMFGGLTDTNVQPTSLRVDATGNVLVSFWTIYYIPANGIIKIDFPAGFNAGLTSSVFNLVGIDGTFSIAISSGDGTNDIVTLTRNGDGTMVVGEITVQFTINGVHNPSVIGPTGTYSIQTQDNTGYPIASDPAVPSDTIVLGSGSRSIPSAPLIGQPTALSPSSINWTFTDTTQDETGFELRNTLASVIRVETPNLSGIEETGLLPNTQYRGRTAIVFNSFGYGYESLPADAVFTLAQTPESVAVTRPNGLSAVVTFAAAHNPESTEFAVQEAQSGLWVQLDGTLGGAPAWQTFSAWHNGSVTVSGLRPDVQYQFGVVARNNEGIQTPLALSTLTTEPPAPKLVLRNSVAVESRKLSMGWTFGIPVSAADNTFVWSTVVPWSSRLLDLALILGVLLCVTLMGIVLKRKLKSKNHEPYVALTAKSLVSLVAFGMMKLLIVLAAFVFMTSNNGSPVWADSGTPVQVGDELFFSVTATNEGSVDAHAVVLTDTIPSGTTYVPGSLLVDSDSTAAVLPAAVTASRSLLPVGTTMSLSFVATVTGAPGTSIVNNAFATSADSSDITYSSTTFSNETMTLIASPIVAPPLPPEPPVPPVPVVPPVEPTPVVPPVVEPPTSPEVVAPSTPPVTTQPGVVAAGVNTQEWLPAAQDVNRKVGVPVNGVLLLTNAVLLFIASTSMAAGLGSAIWMYLQYFLTQPFAFFARKKRKRWGGVFDSVTLKPLDLAIVRLLHAKTNTVAATRVTDKFGRFHMILDPGEYVVQVMRKEYAFPSKILAGKTEIGTYDRVFTGAKVVIDESSLIDQEIPVDPDRKVLPLPEEIKMHLSKRMKYRLSFIGPVASVISFALTPTVLLGVFVVLQWAVWAMFRKLSGISRLKNWGLVMAQETKQALHQVVVRIFDTTYNKLLETQVTDAGGRYGFLVTPNTYVVTAEKAGFSKHETDRIAIKKAEGGMITENITLNQT